MGALYRLDFPSGKSYIGITMGSVESRFREHVRTAKKGSAASISRAIRKYGTDAVKRITLAISDSWEYLQLVEKNAIRVFGTFGKGGYNSTLGGEGTQGLLKSPEVRARISAAKRGVPQTPEAIAARAAALRGRPVSAETRQKISAANTGRKRTEEQRAAMSVARRGKAPSEAARAKLSQATKNSTADVLHARRVGIILAGKGVSFDKTRERWAAYVSLPGRKTRHLGRFDTEQEALAVRAEAVRKLLAGEPL